MAGGSLGLVVGLCRYGIREMKAAQGLIDAGLVRLVTSSSERDSAAGYTHYYRSFTIELV